MPRQALFRHDGLDSGSLARATRSGATSAATTRAPVSPCIRAANCPIGPRPITAT